MSDPVKEKELYEALGRAIAEWQLLEISLCMLLSIMLRPDNLTIGTRIFYAPQNFKDKLSVVDACARVVLPATVQKEWHSLFNKLNRLARRRNGLAHASVGYSNFLGEHIASESRWGSPSWNPAEDLTVKKIRDRHCAFSLAKKRIARLSSALVARS